MSIKLRFRLMLRDSYREALTFFIAKKVSKNAIKFELAPLKQQILGQPAK